MAQSRSIWNWPSLAQETAVAVGAAALFLASCVSIRVAPTDRIGQVSGLAALGYRFVIASAVLVATLVLAARAKNVTRFELVSRLACAAAAGLAGGFLGGGLYVALRGTPFGVNGLGGDAGALVRWADGTETIPPMYPPLSIHILRNYAELIHLPAGMAIKHMEILGSTLAGPIGYLSWRLVLRPIWALALGGVLSFILVDQYKPYPLLILLAFVPIAIVFLTELRTSHRKTLHDIWKAGVGFGVVFGAICLMYSGWFQWSALGLLVATLIVFPWKTPSNAIHLLVLTAMIFILLCGRYAHGLLFNSAGAIVDKFVYFDVKTDPMYIAMWRDDRPGPISNWPPFGELGGVGLFTLFLALGLGGAIALARRTTAVITVSCVMVGAWFMRFQYARKMWETGNVQLYPRTTPLILYCLIILIALAAYHAIQRLNDDHPLRGSSAVIGAMCALLLVFASEASSTSDRFMPNNVDPINSQTLTYNAYLLKRSVNKDYRAAPMPWIRHDPLTKTP